jgi:hypothetical protein
MSLRGVLRQEAEETYLAAGERVQETMLAVTIRPLLLYPLGWLLLNRDAYRAVICTDRRILLCKVDHTTGSLKGPVQTEDRRRRLGPPTYSPHAPNQSVRLSGLCRQALLQGRASS